MALMLGWGRVRFTPSNAIVFGLMISFGWESGLLSLPTRTVFTGLFVMLAFGLFEPWPKRLPRWLARWALQVLGVALAIPLGTWMSYVIVIWLAVMGARVPQLVGREPVRA